MAINNNNNNNNNYYYSTAKVPSSRLDHSMWVSWLTKQNLGRFFLRLLPFPLPQTSFHHFTTLISSISIHLPAPVMVCQAWLAGIHAIHTPSIKGLHRIIPRPDPVSEKLRIYYYYYYFYYYK